jgi:hypothetical protein
MKWLSKIRIVRTSCAKTNDSRHEVETVISKSNDSPCQDMITRSYMEKRNEIIALLSQNTAPEMLLWSDYLLRFDRLCQEARELLKLLGPLQVPNAYLVGSMFLYDSYQRLNRGPEEHLFFVTGLRLGKLLTLDHICEFKVESASRVHARGDISSSHLTLINLDNLGHRLHALFHKHPGKGIGATFPSSTDIQTQERMERGGYPVIGAVFSEDGYIRFFSANRQFMVNIYGKGVNCVDDKVFQLADLRELPS